MMEAGEPPSQPPMETQQAEPYAGVAVPVNEMQPVAPVPYTGAPLAPVEAVAQESLPLPTMQAFRGARSGSVMHIQLADGRILEVAVPPGTPPGHQIHFPVATAGPIPHGRQPALAPAPQQPMARAGIPLVPPPPPVAQPGNVGVASVYAPETVTIQVPPGAMPGSVFRIKLTDGRDLDVTAPAGVQPGMHLTIAVPPRPVDRDGRPLAGIRKKKPHPCGDCWLFAALPCAVWLGGDSPCDCCCRVCFCVFCCG